MDHVIKGPRKFKNSDDDKLDRTTFADNLGDLLANAEAGMVIGLFSPWGSGKTWTLDMVKARLNTKDEVYTVYFGAWDHESDNGLLASLFSTMARQIDEDAGMGEEVKKIARKVARTVLVYGVSLAMSYGRLLALVATNGLLDPELLYKTTEEEWNTRLEFEQWISRLKTNPHQQMKDDLGKLINALADKGKKRIVFLVDDLDRCHPENVYRLLDDLRRLITLTSEVIDEEESKPKGFTGLIAADEEIVRHSIKTKYPEASISVEDYLYKLISISRRLPSISQENFEEFLKISLNCHSGREDSANGEDPHSEATPAKATPAIVTAVLEVWRRKPTVITLRQLEMFARNYAIWSASKGQDSLNDIERNSNLVTLFSLIAQISPRHFAQVKYRPEENINLYISTLQNYPSWADCPFRDLLEEYNKAAYNNTSSKDTYYEDALLSLRLAEEICGFV
jgi:hypothetical protein